MDVLKEIEQLSKGLDFETLNNYESKAEQKHAAWLESRRGKFTASEFHRLMGYEDKPDFPKGAVTYVMEKAIEMLTTESGESYTNGSMEWGNLNEKEAIEKFMDVMDVEVKKFGEDQEFIQLGKDIGCTPDGLISINSGTETKCPNSKTHYAYLLIKDHVQFKKDLKNYYWQIMGSMYVTGRSNWYFISYDPRFRDETKQLKILKIERDEVDIQKLKGRLTEAIRRRNELIKDFN